MIYRVIAVPSLCYRHHQEKQCGFGIHPARLIFIKQRELTQDQSGQNGLISFVWGTRLVGCGRAETVSPGQLGGLGMNGWSNPVQTPLMNESVSTSKEAPRQQLLQVAVNIFINGLDGFTEHADRIC